MREYATLGWILAALFILLGIGAFFSPTYTRQMGYAEAIILGASVLFVVSAVILVAAAGFTSFALYLAILSGLAFAAFGPIGSLLVPGLTYVTWGLAFAIQVLLAYHDVPSATAWFRHHYTCRTFRIEFRLFVPILWLFYLLLEWLPHWIDREPVVRFDRHAIRTRVEALFPHPC